MCVRGGGMPSSNAKDRRWPFSPGITLTLINYFEMVSPTAISSRGISWRSRYEADRQNGLKLSAAECLTREITFEFLRRRRLLSRESGWLIDWIILKCFTDLYILSVSALRSFSTMNRIKKNFPWRISTASSGALYINSWNQSSSRKHRQTP